MTRADIVEKVIAAKLAKKLTWKALAEACGRSEVWATKGADSREVRRRHHERDRLRDV